VEEVCKAVRQAITSGEGSRVLINSYCSIGR
jgi:hypothetical protein